MNYYWLAGFVVIGGFCFVALIETAVDLWVDIVHVLREEPSQ